MHWTDTSFRIPLAPAAPAVPPPLFRSFWMGGFEGADHVNSLGQEVAMNRRTRHWDRLAHDYALLAHMGIRTIRESVGWRAFEAEGRLQGMQRLRRMAATAQASGLQVIWTLHHYGLPGGVGFFDRDFAGRFADFCDVVARTLCGSADGPPMFGPVNEISFLSWAASSSSLMHPNQASDVELGFELKCRLAQAALRGCDALWATCPDARIVHADPLIHVIGSEGEDDSHEQALALTEQQFQAWDMIAGRLEPGLGGGARYLDVLGINYYHNNQWQHPGNQRLHWHLKDERRRGLDAMLEDVWRRYSRPLFIAETGHVGQGRAEWIDDIASAALRCRQRGVPLDGICLYPLVDRPDWEDFGHWHHSGLWDVDPASGERMLHRPAAERLRHWQTVLPAHAPRGAAHILDPRRDISAQQGHP